MVDKFFQDKARELELPPYDLRNFKEMHEDRKVNTETSRLPLISERPNGGHFVNFRSGENVIRF